MSHLFLVSSSCRTPLMACCFASTARSLALRVSQVLASAKAWSVVRCARAELVMCFLRAVVFEKSTTVTSESEQRGGVLSPSLAPFNFSNFSGVLPPMVLLPVNEGIVPDVMDEE